MNEFSPDAEWFGRLYEAHVADLWRFARRRCRSASDADDITAQVFAVAWRRRNELPVDGVRLWLFGVARRVLSNHRRSIDRHQRLQLRLIDHYSDASVEPVASHEALRDALASLSDDDREVVLMRCWDGLSVSDIAVILDCSANAVSVRLHKARRKLVDRLTATDVVGNGHVPCDSRSRMEERHGQR